MRTIKQRPIKQRIHTLTSLLFTSLHPSTKSSFHSSLFRRSNSPSSITLVSLSYPVISLPPSSLFRLFLPSFFSPLSIPVTPFSLLFHLLPYHTNFIPPPSLLRLSLPSSSRSSLPVILFLFLAPFPSFLPTLLTPSTPLAHSCCKWNVLTTLVYRVSNRSFYAYRFEPSHDAGYHCLSSATDTWIPRSCCSESFPAKFTKYIVMMNIETFSEPRIQSYIPPFVQRAFFYCIIGLFCLP